MSHVSVWNIYQDSYGFMWFGTAAGLNKYDGYNVTVYKHDPEDYTTLSSNFISVVFEDKSGILWIGTGGGGLNKYNREYDSFSQYLYDPKDNKSISSNSIFSIYEDREQILWIGVENGVLNKFDRKEEKFTRFEVDNSNIGLSIYNFINSICEDKTGNLWIGTNLTGLKKFDTKQEKFIHYKHNPEDVNSLSDNSVWSLQVDRAGDLWIGTKTGGLNRFNHESNSFRLFRHHSDDSISISDDAVLAILEDKSGILWLGTEHGGLNRYNPKNDAFAVYRNESTNPFSIQDNTIWSLFEDRFGVIWIGTQFAGINKFDREKKGFLHFNSEPGNPNSLSSNAMGPIIEDRMGEAWIGTYYGLNNYDPVSKMFTRYFHQPNDPFSLSSSSVTSIHEDNSGTLWIGTFDGGLNWYNRELDNFSHYSNDPNDSTSISGTSITSILEDSYGQLWVGGSFGLDRLDKKTGSFTHCLNNQAVWRIYEDRENELWISTGRIYKFDRDLDSFQEYLYGSEENNQFSNHTVLTIGASKKESGILWLGTSNGIIRLDKNKNKSKHYSKKNSELLCGDVYGLVEDKQGNLWLSTNTGIIYFDPTSGKAKNFDIDDGLQGKLYNEAAYFQNKRGEIYFGGMNGLNLFHPDSLVDNPYGPEISFIEFKINNASVAIGADSPLKQHISVTKDIVLSYDQTDIEIEFAALHYSYSSKNQYAYQLNNYDKDWRYVGTDRTANYTNLDPGEYTFIVKAANNDGVWNEEGIGLNIEVLPPWWETRFAYTIYFLLITSIIYVIWRFQMSKVQLKHQVELEHLEAERYHEMDQLKSRFFTNISHEFRTPLTLILGPIGKLLSRVEDEDHLRELNLMQRHAKRLLELVTQLLDLSKLDAKQMKVQVSQRNIVPLMKGLVLSFSSLAESRQITLNFSSDHEAILTYVNPDTMAKIINNLVSNAFKFTEPGDSIQVHITSKNKSDLSAEGEAVITVKDTGVGFPVEHNAKVFDRFYQVDDSATREQEGTGIGLALTRELVELSKGKISVESELGVGTIFTLSFPLGKAHLSSDEIVNSDVVETEGVEEQQSQTEEPMSMDQLAHVSNQSLPKVLIVEDNDDLRRYIRSFLNDNYQCQEAENGQEGLEIVLDKMPDLIVSDIMMPKMDGIEFCKRIKGDEYSSHIPVILLTAKADVQSKLEGLETGADDYLTKPFEADELLVRIKNLINQRRRLWEHFKHEIDFKSSDLTTNFVDEQFLNRVIAVIEKHLNNPDFNVEQCSQAMGTSRQHLYRKLKALTNHTPRGFIRSIRLKRAAQLLINNKASVSEVAVQVGFFNPSNFSKSFRQQFGLSPSAYLKRHS
ncbi:MAG: response regulator [Candidatus Marinimicrobia bacterium]|nr:response regulator [FCB group bacterium]MBL7024867.1 response regulator [Candidatus Neomarinimicrobiota bacterium]